jgi:hypothetical protein
VTEIANDSKTVYSLDIKNNDIHDRNEIINGEDGMFTLKCAVFSEQGQTKTKTIDYNMASRNIKIEYVVFDKNNPMAKK